MSARAFGKADRLARTQQAPSRPPPPLAPRARGDERPVVRLTFMLPSTLARSAPPGARAGHGVAVKAAGLIEIVSVSREASFAAAAAFLRRIARAHVPFSVAATLATTARAREEDRFEKPIDRYELVYVDGHVIAARTSLKPAIYAAER